MCPSPAADSDGLVRYHPHFCTHRSASIGKPAAPPLMARTPARSRLLRSARDFVWSDPWCGGILRSRSTRGSADILAVHAENEAHERLRAGKNCVDVTLLVGDLRRQPPQIQHRPLPLKANLAKPTAIHCCNRTGSLPAASRSRNCFTVGCSASCAMAFSLLQI